MLYNADGSPVVQPHMMRVMQMLAKMGTAIAPNHIPVMLVAVKLDQEDGTIQVMVPNVFIPLIKDEGFRDTLVSSVRAQLEEAAAGGTVIEAIAEAVSEEGGES